MGMDITFLIFNMDSINIFYIYIVMIVISILSVVQNIVFFRKSIHEY